VQLTSYKPKDTKYRERGENMAHNSGFPPLLRTRGRHLPFPQFFFRLNFTRKVRNFFVKEEEKGERKDSFGSAVFEKLSCLVIL
jgi:hypothetical protein